MAYNQWQNRISYLKMHSEERQLTLPFDLHMPAEALCVLALTHMIHTHTHTIHTYQTHIHKSTQLKNRNFKR